jgi:hypothetical protein
VFPGVVAQMTALTNATESLMYGIHDTYPLYASDYD